MASEVVIDIESLYKAGTSGPAKLSRLDEYVKQAVNLAGSSNEVVLTGAGPVWLYLRIAHALHGVARKLAYRSPVSGDVIIFDHSPD